MNAVTVNLNPIADGSVKENGDGTIFEGGVATTASNITATMSGPPSTTAVFEFDLSGFGATNVTAARFVLTQAGTALFGGGKTTLQLDGYGGNGVVTASDIHPAFDTASEIDPPVNILASMTPVDDAADAGFDERGFVLDVGEPFAQVVGGCERAGCGWSSFMGATGEKRSAGWPLPEPARRGGEKGRR